MLAYHTICSTWSTLTHVLTLAEYQRLAYAAIDEILARGRLPILVGGTGQYIHAVVEGWSIPAVAPRPELRAELEDKAQVEGAAALHGWLAQLDPAAASRIDYRNVRRVIRALEVCLVTGQPISELQRKNPPAYRIKQFGVMRPRPSCTLASTRVSTGCSKMGWWRKCAVWWLPATAGNSRR